VIDQHQQKRKARFCQKKVWRNSERH
jgi:hypothetical protein